MHCKANLSFKAVHAREVHGINIPRQRFVALTLGSGERLCHVLTRAADRTDAHAVAPPKAHVNAAHVDIPHLEKAWQRRSQVRIRTAAGQETKITLTTQQIKHIANALTSGPRTYLTAQQMKHIVTLRLRPTCKAVMRGDDVE